MKNTESISDMLQEEMQKTNDHMIDAMRFALYGDSEPVIKLTYWEKIRAAVQELNERIEFAWEVLRHGHDCYQSYSLSQNP